jgi:hypothetical protein
MADGASGHPRNLLTPVELPVNEAKGSTVSRNAHKMLVQRVLQTSE